jgi:hypothetical protein
MMRTQCLNNRLAQEGRGVWDSQRSFHTQARSQAKILFLQNTNSQWFRNGMEQQFLLLLNTAKSNMKVKQQYTILALKVNKSDRFLVLFNNALPTSDFTGPMSL